LRPLGEDEAEKLKRRDLPVKKQMNKCKMASLIDDPHQKFVYMYDPKAQWTFMVELVKILLDDPKGTFPKCIKSAGESPKQHKDALVIPAVEDEEFDEDEPAHDDDAYVNAHSEDETSLLEGEEGEEQETEEDAHDDEAHEDDAHEEIAGDED